MEAVVEQDPWGNWRATTQCHGVMYQTKAPTEAEAVERLTQQLPPSPTNLPRRTYRYNYETNKFEKEDN